MVVVQDVWEVVGGGEKGGIIVRAGKDVSSTESDLRLSTGALVRTLELVDGRLNYELISGNGPAQGWVSTHIRGKELLSKSERQQEMSQDAARLCVPSGKSSIHQQASNKTVWASSPSRAALIDYGRRMSAHEGVSDKCNTITVKSNADSIPMELSTSDARHHTVAPTRSDCEDANLCSYCKLPLGESCHQHEGQPTHGECLAQLMVNDLKKAEEIRRKQELSEKKAKRNQYGIGWEPRHIPRNVDPLFKLTLTEVPQGMVCLVFSEEGNRRTIHAASTTAPAAVVNLEYLSTALRVRRTEGREPYFSLDAVDPARKHSMQRKVFSPDWLAETKAGEVLFQADYYLKELSMGEYEQPVVGMHSCFDLLELEGHKEDWSAREWFLVRKAEVSMSDSNVLVPFVKMGVEAREQQLVGDAMEDVPITRPDHPMVKYADAFTKNFDLIAERRSVIFHLRELARASTMAKFIQETGVDIEENWFRLASSTGSLDATNLQVPQLWNERIYSQIQVKDGAVVYDREKGKNIHSSGRGVYGGVSFGLEKLPSVVAPNLVGLKELLKPPRAPKALIKTSLSLNLRSVTVAPRSGLMAQVAKKDLKLKVAGIDGVAADAAPGAAAASGTRGVDLRLDSFDLSAPVPAKSEDHVPTASCGPLEACVAFGEEFWSYLEDEGTVKRKGVFTKRDTNLLRELFNPSLTDRRAEGDCFVPPQSSFKYVNKLRALLDTEESMRQKRIQHFLSENFVMGNPGPLFPSSWAPKSEISCGTVPARIQEGRSPGALQKAPHSEAATHIMKHASPVFDMTSEEGVKFRIYQVGSTEVRTTQRPGGVERIGVVFTIRAASRADAWDPWDECINEQEHPAKATLYVEWAWESNSAGSLSKNCHYYVVFAAQDGNVVVAEQDTCGKNLWVENPEDLEDRNSLAKVLASTSCPSGATFRELRSYKVRGTTRSGSQHYAKGAYGLACGKTFD